MYILLSRLTTLISGIGLVLPLICGRKKNDIGQAKHGAPGKGYHKKNKNSTKYRKMFRRTFVCIKP